MKNQLVAVIMCLSLNMMAQESKNPNYKNTQFGLTLGYIGATAKSTIESNDNNSSVSSSNSEGGFSLGVSLKTKLSEKWYLQPSVQYALINDESFLFVPIMAKFYLADSFNLMAGPQGTFSFEDKKGLPINTFGLDLSFGAGYDFNKHFYLEARYAIELTNRTSNGMNESYLDNGFDPLISSRNIDLKTRLNSFHITIGYRF